jgi:hypothetical protein
VWWVLTASSLRNRYEYSMGRTLGAHGRRLSAASFSRDGLAL